MSTHFEVGAAAGGTRETPAKRLLLIDNYDSFTYNLVQAFLVLGAKVRVLRNDEVTVEEALRMGDITHLCISPGPGTPPDAGVSMAMITRLRRQAADLRRVPGTPVHRRSVRRQRGARAAADARQDLDGEA